MKTVARHIFVLGDVHGHHQEAVHLVEESAKERGVSIDLILQVGDFTPTRTEQELRSVPVPTKYRRMSDFERMADKYPAEVVFIGGNHEPALVVAQIPDGGAVGLRTASQTCHYIGRSGVVERLGLRIAGISGNYSPAWFRKPVEPLGPEPYTNKKQMLYTREADVERLLAAPPVDILLMHEWPQSFGAGIGEHQRNPDGVGFIEGDRLIEHLRPRFCFLGHMHRYHRGQIGETDCIALRQVNPGPGTAWPAAESVAVLRWDGTELVIM